MASKSMQTTASPDGAAEASSKQAVWTVEMTPSEDGNYGYVNRGNAGRVPGSWNFILKRIHADEVFIAIDDGMPVEKRRLPFTMKLVKRNVPSWINPLMLAPPHPGEHPGTEPSPGVFDSGTYEEQGNGSFSCLRVAAAPASPGNQGLRKVQFTLQVQGYPVSHDPDMDVES